MGGNQPFSMSATDADVEFAGWRGAPTVGSATRGLHLASLCVWCPALADPASATIGVDTQLARWGIRLPYAASPRPLPLWEVRGAYDVSVRGCLRETFSIWATHAGDPVYYWYASDLDNSRRLTTPNSTVTLKVVADATGAITAVRTGAASQSVFPLLTVPIMAFGDNVRALADTTWHRPTAAAERRARLRLPTRGRAGHRRRRRPCLLGRERADRGHPSADAAPGGA